MYCSLINRFRGAFLGSAVAEIDSPCAGDNSAPTGLTSALLYGCQRLSSLPSCMEAFAHGDSSVNHFEKVAQTVLISLVLHDHPLKRLRAIQNSQASLGQWLLSDTLALRLQGKTATFEALQLTSAPQSIECPSSRPLLATLESLITQRALLPTATQAIATFPDLNPLDQAIALSLYCWLCTPQQFSIAVGRSHQSLKHFSHSDGGLVPAITGLIAGVSVGLDYIPPASLTNPAALISSADHLFQRWAGVNNGHPDVSRLQRSVVAQLGTLKPRTSKHLTLNSDYD